MPALATPPQHICILRLSAIGDICHTRPIVRTIQSKWPETKITWIIGKTEYELLKGIENIHFIIFDKNRGLREYLSICSQLRNTEFDVLLHMQMSLRASLISLMVKSKTKIGFDRKRAKDGQWLFTNKKINYVPRQHVMDSLFGFSESLGIKDHLNAWNIPISRADANSAKKLLGNISNYFIISPCSSKSYRNWNIQGYAAISDYIKSQYGYDVILTGGNSRIENEYGEKIVQAATSKPINLIGKTSLKELLSIIEGAKCMISPDSGPAHMATAMGTPVIGLYATTNPDRARPYLSASMVVNRYPDAIYRKYNKHVDEVAWGTRVRDGWAMYLITIDDVKKMVDNFLAKSSDGKNL